MISSETKIIHHSIIIHQPLASEKGKTAIKKEILTNLFKSKYQLSVSNQYQDGLRHHHSAVTTYHS